MSATGPNRVDDVLLAVFEEQRPRLRGFFVRGAGTNAWAEDLLQETLLRVWDHRAALAAGAAAEAEVREGTRRYLWRVARNLMIDEIRWRRRRRPGHDVLPDAAEPAPARDGARSVAEPATRGAEEEVEREDCLRVIHETVGHLANDRVRRCLVLWLDGCDLHGIARQLGLGDGQVRGLLQRGRSEIVRSAAKRFRAPRVDAEAGARHRAPPPPPRPAAPRTSLHDESSRTTTAPSAGCPARGSRPSRE